MATNRLATSRSLIVDTLAPTMAGNLDGRVLPYRPARPVSPSMWIDRPSVTKVDGSIVATFPVFGIADGASEASQATLDDLMSRAWDACQAAAGLRPRSMQPQDIRLDPEKPEVVRGFVLTVDHTVNAATLCPPTVESVVVPPDLVEV